VEASRAATSQSVEALLAHPVPAARVRAALAAGRLGSAALLRQVVPLLADERADVRTAAAWALALGESTRGEAALARVAALDDDDGARIAAIRALGLIGGPATVRTLTALLRSDATPAALRSSLLLGMAQLARREVAGAETLAALALDRLGRAGATAEEQWAAAHALATVVDRVPAARTALRGARSKALLQQLGTPLDAALRDQLVRAAVRLDLLGADRIGALLPANPVASRDLVSALLRKDGREGTVLAPLVGRLITRLPGTLCRTSEAVILAHLLGELQAHAAARWLREAAPAWLAALESQRLAATAGSCAALGLARLRCRVAVLADLHARKLEHTLACGRGTLPPGEESGYLAAALGGGDPAKAWAELTPRYAKGDPTAKATLLGAAGRLGGLPAHRLVGEALADQQDVVFSAAAEACAQLAPPVGGPAAVRDHCLQAARRVFLALPSPPAGADLLRWIELVRLLRSVADNPMVERFRAASRSFHPTLRDLALTALRGTTGATAAPDRWDPDDRPPPAEPLAAPAAVDLVTEAGRIRIRLRPDWAPVSAAYVLGLVQRGFYRDVAFHRVVPGFVIQGGDPTGTGHGGDSALLLSEWSPAAFGRGVVGLAHAGKDTEGSQLFVTLEAAPHLDGRYTAIGEVIEGQDVAASLLPGARILSATRSRP
jgi:cyclophilin family peptidyl-prolyl cis-trans isomerase/HEAT repeat protein